MFNITLGCDPEIMLVNSRGELKSAIGVIDGSKDEPLKVNRGMILHDNVNAEFGTDASDTPAGLVDNIEVVLGELNKAIASHGLLMSTRCAADWPAAELDNDDARRFGCDPDFNGWTVQINEIASDAADKPFRTAGGHIHIGNEVIAENFTAKLNAVRMLDATLGTLSILIDNTAEAASRRKLYGKAGCHRPKDYGVEYRTLSNFWIYDRYISEAILNIAQESIAYMLSDGTGILDRIGQKKIVGAINRGNAKAAREIVNEFNFGNYQSIVSTLLFDRTRPALINDGWKF